MIVVAFGCDADRTLTIHLFNRHDLLRAGTIEIKQQTRFRRVRPLRPRTRGHQQTLYDIFRVGDLALFPHFCRAGQYQSEQHQHDGDDHHQFHERECGALIHGALSSRCLTIGSA